MKETAVQHKEEKENYAGSGTTFHVNDEGNICAAYRRKGKLRRQWNHSSR
jgi:hypothetical protein